MKRKPIVKLIIIFIFIINLSVVYIGRECKYDSFNVDDISFIENFMSLCLGELFVSVIILFYLFAFSILFKKPNKWQ